MPIYLPNHENFSNNSIDYFIKSALKLIYSVEDEMTLSNSNEILNGSVHSQNSSNSNENIFKRNFFSVNLAFSHLNPKDLSTNSEFFQNSNSIQIIDYITGHVYKMINKTVKKLTFGNLINLMNPLMHFTDNSVAFSSLLYFEDNFHEDK